MAQKILLDRNHRIDREKYCDKLSTTCVIKELVLKRKKLDLNNSFLKLKVLQVLQVLQQVLGQVLHEFYEFYTFCYTSSISEHASHTCGVCA